MTQFFRPLSSLLILGSLLSGIPAFATPQSTASDRLGQAPVEIVAQSLAKVRIGSLETYEYETGLFSLGVPQNWEVEEVSDSDIVRVLFTDPLGNAFVVVAVLAAEEKLSSNALGSLLQSDVELTFGEEPDFDMDKDPTPQDDGSVGVTFTFTSQVENLEVTLLGNAFIQQDDDYLSLMYVIVPQEQFDDLQADIDQIINSYSIDTSVSLP
ncbi:MAG: hypothetical protein NW237_03305 [Cyanobacteriota bacterium]|nr:hypothetical protein [Cyanobacteriota bacterium]